MPSKTSASAIASENGAGFSDTTARGFTAEQLYSTASYQSGELSGVWLGANDLSGWTFAGKDLTGAWFYRTTLASTDFSGAVVKGASFSNVWAFPAVSNNGE